MDKMSPEAWIFMLSAWILILIATVYSFYRLLTSKRKIGGSSDELD